MISTDNIKTTYLNELAKNGLIDYELSKIHGKQYIYHPLVDPLITISESSPFSSIIDPIDQVSQESFNIYEKITSNITEAWLFYEIMVILSHRVDLSKMEGPFADYLNNHPEFKLSSIQQAVEDNCNNKIRERLTIREFTKEYIEQKSQISIDEKRSPNNPSFGKIIPFSSIQAKIVDKVEKYRDDTKQEVDQFLRINHFEKAEKRELEEVYEDEEFDDDEMENELK